MANYSRVLAALDRAFEDQEDFAYQISDPPDGLIARLDRLRTYIARLEGIIGLLPGEDGDTNPQRMARAFRKTILEEGDLG